MKLMLDSWAYKRKPTPDDIRNRINKSIIKSSIDINVEQLSKELTSGKTFMCGYLEKDSNGDIKRTESYWKSQQVIALDFDNEYSFRNDENKNVKVRYISATLEQALNNEFIKKYAAFAYQTFSHTEEHPKFRVVFVLDRPMYNLEKFKELIKKLINEKFPMVDISCTDGARLFYGGRGLHVVAYDNRLPLDPTLWQDIQGIEYIYPTRGCKSSKVITPTNKSKVKSITYNTNKIANNLKLINQRDIQSLRSVINPIPITLHNKNQVYDYLKQQSLLIYLGTQSNQLYNIFHDEDKPSGSIYQSNLTNGHWLYKCHSLSNPFVGTILQITMKLLACTLPEAGKFLMDVYDITIEENDVQKQLREEIDAYKYILQSDELQELYPSFYKMFNRYGYIENLYVLLDLIKENLPADSDDKRLLFYHSISTLSKKFNKSRAVTGDRMNFFTFFNLIYKLPESEVPEDIIKFQLRNKRNKKYKYRNSTYQMELYSFDFFAELDTRCEDWMKKGLTTKSMNYEGILRNYGRSEADRVFPQDQGKVIAELNEDIVLHIEVSTLNIIGQKGWATEKEILEGVKSYFKGQKKFKEQQLKRSIGEMLDKYNLEIVSSNKLIKAEMNITEEHLNKSSFPKLIRPIKE
ncbi:hypothetical protein [Alkalihalobacillus sp. 1P02AB]|uniref:hypothetical protein n=1 Tax=Alkalihalobacillus sp. 1P02AB TaxID=3132260 RepID=UPI0039A6CE53